MRGSMNTTSDQDSLVPRKGWWSRNWGWVLPLGCLSMVLSCGCLAMLFGGLAYKALGDSPVKAEALERAQNSPEVRAALGTPVEAGMMRQFSFKSGSAGGSADLLIPLKGPQGEGLLRAQAFKMGDRWHYTTLSVELPEGTVDLLHPSLPGAPAHPRLENPGRPALPPVEPLPEDDAEPTDPKPQKIDL